MESSFGIFLPMETTEIPLKEMSRREVHEASCAANKVNQTTADDWELDVLPESLEGTAVQRGSRGNGSQSCH